MRKLIFAIDSLSTFVGKAAAWLFGLLMVVVCVEVAKRYLLNMPTAWIFDATTMLYANLQAAFLSPPVAMSAFYLKGVSPRHVTLNQIFAGMMPYMLIVILCMVIMYLWPAMTLWLPNYLYGSG